MIPALVAVMVLGVGAAYDVRIAGPREAWIPWWVSAGGLLLAAAAVMLRLAPWQEALLGGLLGGGILLLTWAASRLTTGGGGMGLDDLWLAALAGALLGPWGAAWMLLLAAVAASGVLAARRRDRRLAAWLARWATFHGVSAPAGGGTAALPFVPCMALGAMTVAGLMAAGILAPPGLGG